MSLVPAVALTLWFPARWNLLYLVCLVLGGASLLVVAIVDAIRCARAANPNFRLKRYNRWYVYLLIFIGFSTLDILVLDPLQHRVIQAAQILNISMEPTILPGDHFLMNNAAFLFSPPARGDVVSFTHPNNPDVRSVNRVVGLPRERIEIRDNSVYINGQLLHEPYIKLSHAADVWWHSMEMVVVPDDSYFLLGDNRDNSNDSRFAGPIHRSQIYGKATMLYLSWDFEARTMRWDRFGLVLD